MDHLDILGNKITLRERMRLMKRSKKAFIAQKAANQLNGVDFRDQYQQEEGNNFPVLSTISSYQTHRERPSLIRD
jgi:hypothetical protein